MTEKTARKFAMALLNFKEAFLNLAKASKAAENYDVSDHYPFYLINYEEIAPAVAQWCNVHAARLIEEIDYTEEEAETPQPTETPKVAPPVPTPPVEKTEDALMTEELLLIAKLLNGVTFDDYSSFEDEVSRLMGLIGPTCTTALNEGTPGVTVLAGEMRNFIRANAEIRFKEANDDDRDDERLLKKQVSNE